MGNNSRLSLKARPDPGPDPSALPAQLPTSARRTSHDCELVQHGDDIAEGAGVEDGSLQTVRRLQRR